MLLQTSLFPLHHALWLICKTRVNWSLKNCHLLLHQYSLAHNMSEKHFAEKWVFWPFKDTPSLYINTEAGSTIIFLLPACLHRSVLYASGRSQHIDSTPMIIPCHSSHYFIRLSLLYMYYLFHILGFIRVPHAEVLEACKGRESCWLFTSETWYI